MDIKIDLLPEENGKRTLTIEADGLEGIIEVDITKVHGTRDLGYLIRQIGDGLMLSENGGNINPSQVRERQSLAFRPRKPGGRRRP